MQTIIIYQVSESVHEVLIYTYLSTWDFRFSFWWVRSVYFASRFFNSRCLTCKSSWTCSSLEGKDTFMYAILMQYKHTLNKHYVTISWEWRNTNCIHKTQSSLSGPSGDQDVDKTGKIHLGQQNAVLYYTNGSEQTVRIYGTGIQETQIMGIIQAWCACKQATQQDMYYGTSTWVG